MAVDLSSLCDEIILSAACRTDVIDSRSLATFLYLANSVPLTPEWLRRMPDRSVVESVLMGDRASAELLGEHWVFHHDDRWLRWNPRDRRTRSAPLKLYVSARPQDAERAFWVSIAVMAECGAPMFKIAREPRGLLRPDRMVVYVSSMSQLIELADGIDTRLRGTEAQGVPFTRALTPSGLISWGCDPPASARDYGASWRLWLTRKLAAYLLASDAPTPAGRRSFALSRLRADGVQTETWGPSPGLWGHAFDL